MKVTLALVLILALGVSNAFHSLTPSTSEEILNHIQGNNYNIYVLNFHDSSDSNKESQNTYKDIENRIGDVLGNNPEVFYAQIDHADSAFRKLEQVVGVTSVPAVLAIVHGKGVWLSGTNSYLMVERLNDFIPAFKKSSAHHSNPY
mmetsp:Transcript_1220/g.1348  ORF Transcript_1220/g.1348 Transcript_1220/m.1348 type:complete len:146 (-) Transcript_1220:64-501(-)